MTDRNLIAGSSSAVEDLVRAAMGAGAMCLMEKAAAGEVDPRAPLSDALGDFPAEFIKIRAGLVADVVAELSAQRPPLGYVTLAKRPSRTDPEIYEYGVAGSIWPDKDPAENHQAYCEMSAAEDPEKYQRSRPVEYIVADLREVQP